LVWTVDAEKAKDFRKKYKPKCDILLIHINWNSIDGFYYIPLSAQLEVFKNLGRDNYIKLPKLGTNPRGIEISKDALSSLANHPSTRKIEIRWKRRKIKYDPYKRWIEYWKED